MDTSTLVESPHIAEGKRLLESLKSEGFKIDTGFWLFMSSAREWRLWIASKYFDKLGPRSTYKILMTVMKKAKIDIPFELLTAASTSDKLTKAINGAARRRPSVSEMRLTGGVINGVFVEDCYVYKT